MFFPPESKVLFIGDSITDCGRAQPVGETPFGGLGNGYVSMIDALVAACMPDQRLRVLNVGSSGNTVRDLAKRWRSDVFAHAPDYVSIMIGINDVWRQFDCPRMTDTHVGLEEYETTLADLVEQTLPEVKGIVLATPFYIEANRSDAMRARMDEYGAVVKRIASKHKLVLVDTQAAFDQILAKFNPNALAWDRVHPNPQGTMVIAKAFLDQLGFSW